MIQEETFFRTLGVKYDTALALASRLENVYDLYDDQTLEYSNENEKIAMFIACACAHNDTKTIQLAEESAHLGFYRLFEKERFDDAKILATELLSTDGERRGYIRGLIYAAYEIQEKTDSDKALYLIRGAAGNREPELDRELDIMVKKGRLQRLLAALYIPSLGLYLAAFITLFAGLFNIFKLDGQLKVFLTFFAFFFPIVCVFLYSERNKITREGFYGTVFKK